MGGFVNTCRECRSHVHQSVVITPNTSAAHSLTLHFVLDLIVLSAVEGVRLFPSTTPDVSLWSGATQLILSSSIPSYTIPPNLDFCVFPYPLYHCFLDIHLFPPPAPPPPLKVHYLFHLDKINNMAHASHSNQFQPRQHNQTKRCTRFNVAVDTSRLFHGLPPRPPCHPVSMC